MDENYQKKSIYYILLKKTGFELPSDYYNISLLFLVKSFLRDYKNNFLAQLAKRSFFLGSTLSLHWVRQFYHRLRGCQIGINTRIAEDCIIGLFHPHKIIIEDDVAISARCLLLEHKRDLSLYRYNDSIMDCNYTIAHVILKKGCFLGVGSIIMPGVQVGEGAIVAAGSVVHNDVQAYTIVQGNPATKVFDIPARNTTYEK